MSDIIASLILCSSIVIFAGTVLIGFSTVTILIVARHICAYAVRKKFIPPWTEFCQD